MFEPRRATATSNCKHHLNTTPQQKILDPDAGAVSLCRCTARYFRRDAIVPLGLDRWPPLRCVNRMLVQIRASVSLCMAAEKNKEKKGALCRRPAVACAPTRQHAFFE